MQHVGPTQGHTHPGERLRPLFWALISPSCSFHEVRSVHTRGQRETVRQAKKTAICIRSEWNAAPSLFETLKYLETHRCETALRLYYQPVTFLCERRRLHRRTPLSQRRKKVQASKRRCRCTGVPLLSQKRKKVQASKRRRRCGLGLRSCLTNLRFPRHGATPPSLPGSTSRPPSSIS